MIKYNVSSCAHKDKSEIILQSDSYGTKVEITVSPKEVLKMLNDIVDSWDEFGSIHSELIDIAKEIIETKTYFEIE